MGKSTISMVIFNSYVKLPEGTLLHTLRLAHRSHGGWAHRNRRQSAAASDGSSARQPGRSCRGWLCRWPCTYRRREGAKRQMPSWKFVVSFQMVSGCLVEPTKISLVPDLNGTRGTPAISW